LTEGIDVPAVDMVAFIDPRHSRVDIAQATGRAMRKPRGFDKDIGYVVIPLFLHRKIGETLEEAFDRSDFADGVSFQRTLIDKMSPDRKKRLNELGFEWDPFGADWENGFAALVKFKEREGHCRVARNHIEDSYNLGTWITNQRTDADKMSPERKKRLHELGFVWDPLGADWENAFAALVKFKEREGHCRVPVNHVEGDYRLGAWVVKRRADADKIFPDRKKRLDELGFVWNPLGADWENGFAALVKFKEREGHLSWTPKMRQVAKVGPCP
jgi:hypothetical protein